MKRKKRVDAYVGEFAIYKKGELLTIGTAEECAEELNVTVAYVKWMTTPTGKKRLSSRKDPENATTAVKLDDDEEDS